MRTCGQLCTENDSENASGNVAAYEIAKMRWKCKGENASDASENASIMNIRFHRNCTEKWTLQERIDHKLH